MTHSGGSLAASDRRLARQAVVGAEADIPRRADERVSLVIAMTAVLAWDLSSARTRLVRDTGMLADVIGSNSNAAVAFGDAESCRPRCCARWP